MFATTKTRPALAIIAAISAVIFTHVSASAARLWVPLPTQKNASEARLVQPAGDPREGSKVFARCAACHATGEGAETRIGPHLNGIIGRRAGAVSEFAYSTALQRAGSDGLRWTRHYLSLYLKAPNDMLPGNKMAFAGLPDADERADLIAFLATLPDDETADAEPELGTVSEVDDGAAALP